MKKTRTVILCILAFGLSMRSSEQPAVIIEKRVLVSPNSTSHVFKMPVQRLKDSLAGFFLLFRQIDNFILNQVFHHYYSLGDTGYTLNNLFHAVTAKSAISHYNEGYFEKPNTENDIFLHSAIPWDSPLYYSKGVPLAYSTSFVLKLKRIDNDYTRLTIECLSPSVYTRVDVWDILSCNCGIFPLSTKAVEATTIEEHTLLLYIAGKLGDNSVEPLKMPELLQNVIAHKSILPLYLLTNQSSTTITPLNFRTECTLITTNASTIASYQRYVVF